MRLVAALLCLLPALACADDWDVLNEPGAVAIMRHALAPGTGDPSHFDVQDCGTQRNLDGRGRAQAKAIGSALRDRGVTFDAVLSSQWCRCLETAELLDLGPVTQTHPLNSFFRNRSSEAAQTEATRQIIQDATGPVMMVTHQVNITALTGIFPSSGEIIVIRAGGDGIEVLGRIEIAP